MAAVKASAKAKIIGGDVMLGALFAELLGTAVLTGAILATSGNAVVAALAVVILVLVFSKISGGHFNPAVTIALLTTKSVSAWRAVGYVIAQLLGAMLALIVVTQFFATGEPMTDAYGTPLEVFKAAKITGQWEPFMAEILGALIFGFGIGAAVLGKKEGFEAAFTVGGALLLGLVVATLGSAAVLNPAVGLGLSVYSSNLWSALAFAVGPIVGMAAGVWAFKLLQWDVTKGQKS